MNARDSEDCKRHVDALLRRRLGQVQDSTLPDLETLEMCNERVPSGWNENGNILLSVDAGIKLNLISHPGLPLATNSTVVVASRATPPTTVTLWGNGALVVIGAGTTLPGSNLACGGNSAIVLGENISCAGDATLNARNGGLIWVGSGGLWSNRIYVSTDDMHAILDAETGERINVYGGSVLVGDHVWLGLEVMLLGGTTVGRDCVVGARSVVKIDAPSNSIVTGVPARVTRRGVNWSHDDLPRNRNAS